MITIRTLRVMGACDDAQEAFQRAYPDGCSDWFTLVNHPNCVPEWRCWIFYRAPELTLEEHKALLQSRGIARHKDGDQR